MKLKQLISAAALMLFAAAPAAESAEWTETQDYAQ